MQWIESVGKGAAKCWFCIWYFLCFALSYLWNEKGRCMDLLQGIQIFEWNCQRRHETLQSNNPSEFFPLLGNETIRWIDYKLWLNGLWWWWWWNLNWSCRLREYWSGWTLMMMSINSLHCRVYLETLKSRCVESCSKERCAKHFYNQQILFFLEIIIIIITITIITRCMAAVKQFYRSVPKKHSLDVAFCLCKWGQLIFIKAATRTTAIANGH